MEVNYLEVISLFCDERSDLEKKWPKKFAHLQTAGSQGDIDKVLIVLTSLILEEETSDEVVAHFRSILLEILHRISRQLAYNYDEHGHRKLSINKLLHLSKTYPIARKFLNNCICSQSNDWLTEDKNNVGNERWEFIKNCFEFLHLTPSVNRTSSWSFVLSYLNTDSPEIKWFTFLSLAILCRFSPVQISKLLSLNFDEQLIHNFVIKFHLNSFKNINLLRLQKQKNYSKKWLPAVCQKSNAVVDVSEVLLSKCENEKEDASLKLVQVPSTVSNLRSLSIAVKSCLPVLLQGPVGCGKTALVEHLASVAGKTKQLLKIQLGDHTDSKMLLGNYQCVDGPAQFVWQPGALIRALELGYWVLLEDIDSAPNDVVSLLIPLLETRSLPVPGRSTNLKAHPDFQLFVTRRLLISGGNSYKDHLGEAELVYQLFTKITVEPLSSEELKTLIVTKWPHLQRKDAYEKIIQVYLSLKEHSDSSYSTGRSFSTRDLLKWCSRVDFNFDGDLDSGSINLVNSFQDALDCFCYCFSNKEQQKDVSKKIASKMNITENTAYFYCEKYKPEVKVNSEIISIGRVTLSRVCKDQSLMSRGRRTRFAYTRQSSALLEQIARAVSNCEPVLLVGETGTGKTATVQYLTETLGQKLVVINMNQQSDASDFLGGFKPIDLKFAIKSLIDDYLAVFRQSFSMKANEKFLNEVSTLYERRKWGTLFALMQHTHSAALKHFSNSKAKDADHLLKKWTGIGNQIFRFQSSMKKAELSMSFKFIEGSLVKALIEGYWVLLDEINLAPAETLECLSGVLENNSGSILLLEKGELQPVKRHPNFRLLACMNAATDVGKKDLPSGLRNRFSEFYMDEPDETELGLLVENYLDYHGDKKQLHFEGIREFYCKIKRIKENELFDGVGRRPHFSLRNFCRALSFASENSCKNITRSLYEGFCFSYLTQLNRASHDRMMETIRTHILKSKNAKKPSELRRLPSPADGKYEEFEGYWVRKGDQECTRSETYILTDSVRRHLKDLARVVSAGRCPVLLQGSTSVGKTSLIKWLAEASGNKCLRVNNHEHTDLQEYLGTYATDENGHLVFKEGVLVDAMRRGYWIVLDELNLAPTDVLEALNRVLDDNREIFIPETQETVKAHPKFLLFATQNPPGLYGGRKVLSRAFRNRFIELHFEEIPSTELQDILQKRCGLPPSYCKKMVFVMQDLQSRRSTTGIFAGKHGLITIRDLFRWAERYRLAKREDEKFYDWDQHLADEGYMLLAGRVRKEDEADFIAEIIQKYFKRKIDPLSLFTATVDSASPTVKTIIKRVINCDRPSGFQQLVWTYQMRRLAVLIAQALEFGEPVLLVGETGCGKTTVCQLLASLMNKPLHIINCHMHSEASDFLGGLRPVRRNDDAMEVEESQEDLKGRRLFEWVDGQLVTAMKEGNVFLADEISLADDSVLERLNSVLEPERTLLLAEKGLGKDGDFILTASETFRFLATMNPGGDYGKKELSPALRNRFTEIWCPNTHSREDLLSIIEHNLHEKVHIQNQEDGTSGVGHAILDFVRWFKQQSQLRSTTGISIRNILSWVEFINVMCSKTFSALETPHAFIHGAFLVYIDAIGAGCFNSSNITKIRDLSVNYLFELVERRTGVNFDRNSFFSQNSQCIDEIVDKDHLFGLGSFYIEKGPICSESLEGVFTMKSPTTNSNMMRVMRAMQLTKPILLEGSPGIGKTSLLLALAKASGHPAVRINLSDQTDISDLFGADLPVEDGMGGEFAWRDGPLLSALKEGHWVILDELNLASQSVLEGLNACLDHRAEIHVPELGRTFRTPENLKRRIFACQNPLHEGGSRKGLPRSFLNRFTQVYLEPLTKPDLLFITSAMYPQLELSLVANMVDFHDRIYSEVVLRREWGTRGGPWDINLRDLLRWCQIAAQEKVPLFEKILDYVKLIYGDRMRTLEDKSKVVQICNEMFEKVSIDENENEHVQWQITSELVQIGYSILTRNFTCLNKPSIDVNKLHILPSKLPALRSLAMCIQMNWMAILVGPRACGKTSLVSMLAKMTNQHLEVLSMNSGMDTTELLGGFEQVDLTRQLSKITSEIVILLDAKVREFLLMKNPPLEKIKKFLQMKKFLEEESKSDADNELKAFTGRIEKIKKYILKFSDDSEVLIERLDKLLILIERDGGLSCGGRFEWVNSRLVTSLERGNWLQIDNVNLCSPCVLDRLNGLLEPNGVLIMSERGKVNGNELITYKPHPNFRLILCMDPKNGEISRAMRNRGVEIYLENELQLSQLELKALLDAEGLVGCEVQKLLRTLHDRINERRNTNKFSITDLLLTARLTVQRLQEGDEILEALRDSCIDVYVKQQLNLNLKQESVDIVNEIFQAELQIQQVFYPSQIAEVDDFNFVPELARAKIDSAALLHLSYHKLQDADWNECQILGLNCLEKYKDFEKLLYSSWKIFLMKSSFSDFKLRFDYIKSLLEKSVALSKFEDSETLKRIGEVAWTAFNDSFVNHFKVGKAKIITSGILEFSVKEVPYDLRWNSDFYVALFSKIKIEESSNMISLFWFINKLVVSFEFNIFQANYQCSKDEFCSLKKIKEQNLSIMKLSWAYIKGKQSRKSNFPEVFMVNLDAFFTALFATVKYILNDSPGFTTDDVKKWFLLLMLIKRFYNICYNCDANYTADVENAIEWNWNSMLRKGFEVVFKQNERSELRSSRAKLSSYFESKKKMWFSLIFNSRENNLKTVEKLLTVMESSKPFQNEMEANIHHRLYKLYDFACTKYSQKEIVNIRGIVKKLLGHQSNDLHLSEIEELETAIKNQQLIEDSNYQAHLQSIFNNLFVLHQHNFLMNLYAKLKSGGCYVHVLEGDIKVVMGLAELSHIATPNNLVILQSLYSSILANNVDLSLFADLQTEHFMLFSMKISSEEKFENKASDLYSPHLSITTANLVSSTLGYEISTASNTHSILSFSPNLPVRDCESMTQLFESLSSLIWNQINTMPSSNHDVLIIDANILNEVVSRLDEDLNHVLNVKDNKCPNEHETLHCLRCSKCGIWRKSDAQFISTVTENLHRLNSTEERDKIKFYMASAWAGLGLLKAFLSAPLLPADPVVKRYLKKEFWIDVQIDLSSDINACELQDEMANGNLGGYKLHPLIHDRSKHLTEVNEKIEKYSSDQIYRPTPSQFENLRMDLGRICINSSREFHPLDDTVYSIVCSDIKGKPDLFLNRVKSELRCWLESVKRLLNSYSAYRDLTTPAINSILQMAYGLSLYLHFADVKHLRSSVEGNIEILSSLILEFPNTVRSIKYQPCYKRSLDLQTEEIKQLIFSAFNEEEHVGRQHFLNLMKSSLLELKNQVISVSVLRNKEFELLEDIIKQWALVWQRQLERKEEIEKEKENLFTFKAKEYGEIIDDEKQLEASIKRMFPTYSEEFADVIIEDRLDVEMVEDEKMEIEAEDVLIGIISDDDIEELAHIHYSLLVNYGNTMWHCTKSSEKEINNFATPLLQRYQVGVEVLKKFGKCLDHNLDSSFYGAHLMAVNAIFDSLKSKHDERRERIYNFYYDSNIFEAMQCRPILIQLSERINQLLEEWPENSVLLQILKVIERILSFSVTSPIMKFVTGFEILLEQAEEWEKIAHKGVSIMDSLEAMRNQIKIWRGQELSSWPICLDEVENKSRKAACSWWFHIFNLINSDTQFSINEVENALKSFCENSPIGEYEERLKMLFAFTCHLAQRQVNSNLNQSSPVRKRKLLFIFWNMVQYYSQFLLSVQNRIKDVRKPIEKSLKDFKKISSWKTKKDLGKQSHSTLHKHIKQYEKALKEDCSSKFDVKNPTESSDVSKLKIDNKIVVNAYKSFNDEVWISSNLKNNLFAEKLILQHSISHYWEKSQKLCDKSVRKSSFINLAQRLDESTGDIIDGIKQLQSLEIDRKVSKEKQKSEAKHINLRKRKGLADLFKHLTEIGLSYGQGLAIYKIDPNFFEIMRVPPVCIKDTVCQLNKKILMDDILIDGWNDCSWYYYRTISQVAGLQATLMKPSEEIDNRMKDRFIGFSFHLLKIGVEQKKLISESVGNICRLRSLLNDCELVSNVNESQLFPPQTKMDEWSQTLIDLLATVRQSLGQFLALMHTRQNAKGKCHELEFLLQKEIDWKTVTESTANCLKNVENIWKDVEKLNLVNACFSAKVFTWEFFEKINEAFEFLNIFISDFQLGDEKPIVVLNCLRDVKLKVSKKYLKFVTWRQSLSHEDDKVNEIDPKLTMKLKNSSLKLSTKLLLVIEEIYKFEKNKKISTEDEEKVLSLLKEPLEQLFVKVNLRDIYKYCRKLLKYWKKVSDANAKSEVKQYYHKLFCQPLPILRQYVSMCEFYLIALVKSHRASTKLNSILLGLFTELTTKGFCLPPGLEDDATSKDIGTELKDIEGGGIGEGDGNKDVSDRLEHEDQLDDAHQQDSKEEKKEDKDEADLKDEEHGVEMSDDFDGKVHDLEGEEDNDESNDESDIEEDLEKQMGDLEGDDAEKLDEKVWGSDSEDDDDSEDDEEKDEEEGPGAGKQEQSKIVAKDNSKDSKSGEEKSDDDEKDNDNEDHKEINIEDDREYDDRPDPYQNKDETQNEKQADDDMELPEDMQMDEDESEEKADENADSAEEEEEGNETDKDEDTKTEEEMKTSEETKNDEETKEQNENSENDVKMENEVEESIERDDSKGDEIGDDKMNEDETNEEEMNKGNEPNSVASKDETHEKKVEASDQVGGSSDVAQGGEKTMQESNEANETSAEKEDPDEMKAETGDGGQAQDQAADGHLGEKSSSQLSAQQAKNPQLELKNQSSLSNEKRSLGSKEEPYSKRLKTDDSLLDKETDDSGNADEEKNPNSDLYSHVQNSNKSDAQVLDAATEAQMKEQVASNEEGDDKCKIEENIEPMEDENDPRSEFIEKKAANQLLNPLNENQENKVAANEDLSSKEIKDQALGGDNIPTLGAARGLESFIGTNVELWNDKDIDIKSIREELTAMIDSWNRVSQQMDDVEVTPVDRISFQEAELAWSKFEEVTSHLAQELCEQLRLTLEPTVAAKFKGDFRTGKRLNMRKVIPYIASQFRKDKIWLRRSKPSKRDYKIIIAIDDSSSMGDNHSKELAFESLALITKALSLLEAGEVSVASFGEEASILHPFDRQFNTSTGAEVLRQLRFEQKKTIVSKMLDLAVKNFAEYGSRSSASNSAQLLVLISDGRGLFNAGTEVLKRAVRRANETGLLTVFIALDNPNNEHSIFDISSPNFKEDGEVEIRPYMESFPFQFYVVLRELSSLPTVLGDALRQWFELINNSDK